ncbi:MAG TPA: beta-galactosidase GalA [Candidatus Didemnitutus sp.]|nr:beta-galactosidase GalA [Candidatus Didemnitutus sp.]
MNRATPFGLVLGLCLFGAALTAAESTPRERLLMDAGWRFHLGNEWGIAQNLAKSGTGFGPAGTAFSDASWRQVDLPHDWAVELPFDPKADAAHGFHAIGPGFPQNNIGWYRRTFDLPKSDAGRRIWLEFDGVFRDATIYVNGWFVGHHESGYGGFRYDVTDVLNCGGSNVVAVRVDASEFEGWFYEGAGIYRHVWLTKTAPLAIAPDGVFVSSHFKDNIPNGAAEVRLQTAVANAGQASAGATVGWEIFGPDGTSVASAVQQEDIGGASSGNFAKSVRIEKPLLWSPENPQLYRLVTTVATGGHATDRVETTFGIRTVAFDANRGFILNGKPYTLKGTCNHQDHAGVGSALPDRLQYFRIGKLKEMGANAYRTSHNPPTPELLDACDHLGMLVMDENRLLGSDALHLEWLRELVLRDRNHPSVAIWSLANEEFSTETTPAGANVAVTMQDTIRALDATRPITYNAPLGNVWEGIDSVIEVRGWSYRIGEASMDAYHKAHPQQPNVGSEQGSTVGTRGIYTADPVRGYVTAYDDNRQSWSNTAQDWVTFFDSRPWLSGGFVWTGFDYRGEPTPYSWPCVNSHFGIFDTCGFPKDNFWYYKSAWTDEPVLHVLPHWNWAGREGQPIDVRVLSNCDEIELFLNGKSLGRKPLPKDEQLKWSVPYAPGVLSAKGYRKGQPVAEARNETTGAAAAVHLDADRATIDANGEDVSVVTVTARDDAGRVVPIAMNAVHFELAGPGRIIGVGNGDPSCHEPDVVVREPVIHERDVSGWRWLQVPQENMVGLPQEAAKFDDASWAAVDVNTEKGPLGNHERGVFRAHFTMTEQELASPAVELWFGHVEGSGQLYVNGEAVARVGDARGASVCSVKKFLHAGDNVVAVGIANWGDVGGLNQGVRLRFVEAGAPGSWSRSLFNGYAEIIVQASRHAGALKLTATSNGLKSSEITIAANEAPTRAAVP